MKKNTSTKNKPVVAVIMGSDSDWPVMSKACDVLKEFNIPFVKKVLSAHRTPDLMRSFAMDASKNGFKVIIAGAGGAAHLPGMTASYTILPVIGVPVTSKALDGLDSLLSIVQMPKGIPVATVSIDNAVNAGLLAAQIIATNEKTLARKLESFRKKQSTTVKKMKI